MPEYATQHHSGGGAKPSSGGIDLKTLLITAVSSAVAAYTCSKLWAPGTLAAAAFTPVLVAIVREGLAKSTDVVTRVVPVRGVVRSARPEGPHPLDADVPADEAFAALPLADDPALRVAQAGEVVYHSRARRARRWRLAILTGLLGFLVCAVVFTVPELVTGGSAAGGGRDTTLFGGKQHTRAAPAVTTTTTTPTTTVTTPQVNTVTVPPPAVTTPTTTAPAPQPGTPTTTVPATTTPAPAGAAPPAVPPG
ncbi:MAG: hypothetical protein QOJ35_1655 [Solirubrobacteraceae bacterium]|nr:hypothetical protein [Solirubrobacteraceae bacterium]